MLAHAGQGALYRLHPLTKLALALPVLGLLPVAAWWVLVLVVAAALIWAWQSGIGATLIRRMALFLAPLAVAISVVHGLLIVRGAPLDWGYVTIYPDGLAHGGMILLRLAALLAAGLLFVLSTPPGVLADGLEDKGLAPGLTYLLTAPLSLAAGLSQEGAVLSDAMRLRGLALNEGRLWHRLQALWWVVIALVRAQLLEAAPRAQMLEARGFRSQPRRNQLSPPLDSMAQFRLRLAMLGLTLAILLWGLWAWL
ncbi:energy-coupling factor transporter transmembrane component T [Paracoccus sp. (in: a-proteobacteria)]|uniref:energy-coupling factor transporter transmembrane component T family protein n=1 Tax=Paracoccus sp. TaxID=267 RepID=UPI00289CA513|nr:energy-coupling factor transporter transmembrane component T [Paracoccus sp. (in: a-proteobacteria)]